jgi:hypothetical protein
MYKRLQILSICLLLGGLVQPASAEQPLSAAWEFFEGEVRPILVDNCGKCHSGERPKGGLRLTSRADLLKGGDSGPAVVPGKPAESLLIRAVRYQDKPRMPPKERLSERRIDSLVRWVAMGVPWPEGKPTRTEDHRLWSFQPVQHQSPPPVKDSTWPKSPVDCFILKRLESKGFGPSRPADKRTLLRRATYDLIGLPPTVAETDAFLADESPYAFAKVVDRLLASPHYGERWGRHWLDVVRYADARDLIQLPVESDFREAWRYRDWIVDSFNSDVPFTEFLRFQIAGDLLQPRDPSRIHKDALIATGMLAIADFVPGDTDKEMMVADYVNDQIDVVGRAFMGLTLACARCHDHKFDPITTRDYYALAGIFFSTRLIPAPVEGNTPLIRVPLLSLAEISQVEARRAADNKRRQELERQLSGAAEREYCAFLKRIVSEETARYLIAACAYKHRAAREPDVGLSEFAKEHGLQVGWLAGWVEYLQKAPHVQQNPELVAWSRRLSDAAAGKLERAELERSARELKRGLAAAAIRKQSQGGKASEDSAILCFRADDKGIVTTRDGHVTWLPNRAHAAGDAAPAANSKGPLKTTAVLAGNAKPVLRFDGKESLQVPHAVPATGSLFLVFKSADYATAGRRLVGWEDSDVGKHGLGLMVNPGSGLHAILRNEAKNGDIAHSRTGATGFELVSLTWGSRGVTLYRDGKASGANASIDSVSSDPAIPALRIGGPGSGSSPWFQGELAEVRVYDRQLQEADRRQVETELIEAWFKPGDRKGAPSDPLDELYEELISPRGPFWPRAGDKLLLLPKDVQARLTNLRHELGSLKNQPATLEIPRAVVVQDGGPKGTKHEGFKDAHIFIRGNPRNLGSVVPRGFPRMLSGDTEKPITQGSGRLQLADWLTRPDHPLTARVLVNRLWQHHFGEGIVRTANNFGERGERPTHPELLDYLAERFVQSGWSIKAIHRLIMLSAVYQQSSLAASEALAADPDNRLFGRMNRRRLEAEAIRDSLLAAAGRLDTRPGAPAFQDIAVPRRTLYLLSVRTGEKSSGFGALFDRPDPSSIVEKRGVSTTAPQALFMLNDPFVAAQAAALADRVVQETPVGDKETRIRRMFAIVLGRPPTRAELKIDLPLHRYCHMILCTNEFMYVD